MSNTPDMRSLIEQLGEFETPLVAEGLAALGCPYPTDRYRYMGRDIRLMTQCALPTVGSAIVIECDTSTSGAERDASMLFPMLEASRTSDVPGIVVCKAVGKDINHEATVGDGMGKMFRANGIVGFISDGGARDLDRLTGLGFAVYASGAVADHAAVNYRKTDRVRISNVDICDGDLIHADDNGVILVPAEYHHIIVEACCLSRDFETRSHVLWRQSRGSIDERRKVHAELDRVRRERCRALVE
ncbi:MAG: hypothetical protein CMJ18_01240 [Phycisphaeraceae bacterium]|nr:hypothetical protein [Phycisphaeraceae bacterium]